MQTQAIKVEGVDIGNEEVHTERDSVVQELSQRDEALKVLGTYSGPVEWTSVEEKKLVKRIDVRLMTILFITYGLQFYDKSMLSQAAIFGIIPDLGLTGERYSFSSSIFYLGFICGSYPSVILAQRYPIERVIAAIVALWGICLLLTIVCVNYQGLYAQRFFLGFLESGVSPTFMMVVGGWYKRDEQALRMGIWYSAIGYFTIISPLINYGFGQVQGSLQSWKYMFCFAGALTILWGIVILFCLPPDPTRSKGFSERERFIAVARLRTNNTSVRNKHFKWSQALELAVDLKFWVLFFATFFCFIINGPVTTFLPIIIRSLGFTPLQSLLLLAPAGALIGTLALIVSWVGMKKKDWRCYLIIVCQLVSLMAALRLWRIPQTNKGARLFGIYTLAVYACGYALQMAMAVGNFAGYTKRCLSSSGIFVGYCLGNFVGPLVFFAREAPLYNTGWIVTVVSVCATAGLILLYRIICMIDNKKRDQKGVPEGFDNAFDDDCTDKKNPQFRFNPMFQRVLGASILGSALLVSAEGTNHYRLVLVQGKGAFAPASWENDGLSPSAMWTYQCMKG